MKWWTHRRRPMPSPVHRWSGLEWVLAAGLYRPIERDGRLWVCMTDVSAPPVRCVSVTGTCWVRSHV